jgi:Transglycosylase SLT domain
MSGLSIHNGLSIPPQLDHVRGGPSSSRDNELTDLLQLLEQVLQSQLGQSNDEQPRGGNAAPTGAGAPSGGSGHAGGAAPTPSASAQQMGGSTLAPNLPPALEQYRPAIEEASKKTGVPANLIAAQVWQESRGDAHAGSTNVNGLTDSGLMQVNPNTFKELQQKHPQLQGMSLSDPATNIMAGACYMQDMAQQFGGDYNKALRAYNSGPDQVHADLSSVSVGDPDYVNTVMNFASIIQKGGALPA